MKRRHARAAGVGVALAAVLMSCQVVRRDPVELPPLVHPDATEHREVRTGHELYYSLCASCHGVSARGDGPLVPELRSVPADLTLIAARRGGVFPEHEVHEIIDGRRLVRAHGPGRMPVWGRYFARATADPPDEVRVRGQIMSMVDYLKSIQRSE